mgnify:CR=1 FL=1
MIDAGHAVEHVLASGLARSWTCAIVPRRAFDAAWPFVSHAVLVIEIVAPICLALSLPTWCRRSCSVILRGSGLAAAAVLPPALGHPSPGAHQTLRALPPTEPINSGPCTYDTVGVDPCYIVKGNIEN